MDFVESLGMAILPKSFRENIYPEIGVVGGDPDQDYASYRALGGGPRDISESRLRRANSIAYWMFMTNPYGRRTIEIVNDFIIGGGIKPEATGKDEEDREKTQYMLDEIWFGNPHNFDQRADDYLSVLHLFGELIFPFEVNSVNGKLEFAYIDPENVEKITLSTENALRRDYLKLSNQEKKWKIVNSIDDNYDSGVFLFQINKIVNATRGAGILLPVIDLLQSLDDLIFSELERVAFLKSFVWDVTIEGKTDQEIVEYAKKQPAPKPGTSFYHNEKVNRQAVSPDLKMSDTSNMFKIIASVVSVGLGFPEHWLGNLGGDINRATAAEMNNPPIKRMIRRQDYVKQCFELILDYGLKQAIEKKRETEHGPITKDTDISYNLQMPEISPKDINALLESMKSLSESLAYATSSKWISDNAAGVVWRKHAESNLGIEIPEDDQKTIDKEKDDAPQGDAEDLYMKYANKLSGQKND